MEGPRLFTSSDPENDFDTKKSKEKRKRFVFESADDSEGLTKRRHIAQEALRHEEVEEKPKSLFAELAIKKPEPTESSWEKTESDPEVMDEGDGDLSEEEKLFAAQTLRRENRQQRHVEVSPESDAPPVIAAGDLLVDEWDERIEDGQDPDEALDAVLDEHNIHEILDELPENTADIAPDLSSDEQSESESPHDFNEDEVVINTHARPDEAPPSHDEEPPQPPPPGLPPTGRPFGQNGDNFDRESEYTANVVPSGSSTTRESEPVDQPEYRYQANPAATALLGGIIGYFIGRRRGRIKTEKKLLPIQKKLEKQVTDLSWELRAKEAKIRRVAAEYVQREGPAVVETMTTKAQQAKELRAKRDPETRDTAQQKPSRSPFEEAADQYRFRGTEAKLLHGAPEAPEHIGHVLVTAESTKRSKEAFGTQQSKEKTKEKIELPPNKRIETLSRPELLELSTQITVEGSSLRQIYETHLIGERGLRRLVNEYLRGGDVKKVLQREIVEHEIDFERDPALRDLSVSGDNTDNTADPVSAPAKETLEQLLRKAEAGIAGDDEALAYYKARADYEVERSEKQQERRQVMDIVMIAAIVVLVVLVIVLLFWHR